MLTRAADRVRTTRSASSSSSSSWPRSSSSRRWPRSASASACSSRARCSASSRSASRSPRAAAGLATFLPMWARAADRRGGAPPARRRARRARRQPHQEGDAAGPGARAARSQADDGGVEEWQWLKSARPSRFAGRSTWSASSCDGGGLAARRADALAKLPLVSAAALGAGFVLAGGIGATARLLFRRGSRALTVPRARSTILKRAGQQFMADDCMGLAQQVAYSSLLAFFPAVAFLLGLLGIVTSTTTSRACSRRVAPHGVIRFIDGLQKDSTRQRVGRRVRRRPRRRALGGERRRRARSIKAVNRAYGCDETRPFWRVRLIALAARRAHGADDRGDASC